jgi:hypothetical protein
MYPSRPSRADHVGPGFSPPLDVQEQLKERPDETSKLVSGVKTDFEDMIAGFESEVESIAAKDQTLAHLGSDSQSSKIISRK